MREEDVDGAIAKAALLHQLSLDHLKAAIEGKPPPPPPEDAELAKLIANPKNQNER